MKSFFLILLILATVLFQTGCDEKAAPRASEKAAAAKQAYHCPMHPQILRDQAATCPLCGMDLVVVDDGAGEAAKSEGNGPVVRIDPSMVRNLGIRTMAVARRPLSGELRLDGRVTPAEDRVFSVTCRTMGYVEVVHVASSGTTVRKGQPLLEIFSPDVIATEERLVQAIDKGRDDSYEKVRQRLLNVEVPEALIQRIEKTGQPERLFPVLSPTKGIITRKNVIRGQSVMAGTEMYQIADLSEVWITARVYQADLAWVRTGSRATLRFRNLPDQEFESVVFFVSPELDAGTRTAEIRMRLRNTPATDLRPEMFVEVLLQESSPAPRMVIPSQALIRTGRRHVVVLSLGGGRFQPREVTAGRETGDWIEILEGVREGQEIVTSAQFLIDSESSLRAAVTRLHGDGEQAAP